MQRHGRCNVPGIPSASPRHGIACSRWLRMPIDASALARPARRLPDDAACHVDVTGRYLFNRPLEGTTEIVAA